MTSDRVIIKDLLVRGILGINDWEREQKQDIVINLVLFTDLQPAGQSDDIAATVNYRTVAKRVIEHVEGATRFTAEALAHDIATICLAQERVRGARVRVEKPGAVRFAASVGVEIERFRER